MPLPKGNLVTPIGIDDADNLWALLVDPDGRLVVRVLTSGLPAGAATEAKLEAVRVLIAAQLLPTGAATADRQNAQLTALNRLLAVTPTIYNVTMTLADNEYSQALPANVSKFTVKCRTNYPVKLCFTVNESNVTYITIPPGQNYWEDNLYRAATTLYFQCPVAAQVLEIVAWS